MLQSAVSAVNVHKARADESKQTSDLVAVEEPLEVRVQFGPEQSRKERVLAVIMRTPGHDEFLTLGFMCTEGIIQEESQVLSLKHCTNVPETAAGNVIMVKLAPSVELPWDQYQRHIYMSSSCGVCGKTSLEAVVASCHWQELGPGPQLQSELLYQLPTRLKELQLVFNRTGGLHAACIFNSQGEPLYWQEDIGRHNAVDKVIGAAWQAKLLPLDKHVLLVSGRIGFELVQKSVMAGIRFMAGVGAPSSLAVDLAVQHEMTLVGFLNDQRYNCYHQPQRIMKSPN